LRSEKRDLKETVLPPTLRALYLTIPIFVFLFLTVVSLQRSRENGRLSIPPSYDDVVYLFYSQSFIHSVAHQSLSANAYQIVHQHSPLTTLFGVIGYCLVPMGELGPYIVGAGHLLLYLLACALLLRRLPAMLIVGVVCAVGAVPLLRYCIVEFRPEPAWASLTAVSAIAFFAMDPFSASRRDQIGLGLLVGFAVISKPTTAPVTIVILGPAFVASALVQYLESRKKSSAPSVRVVVLSAATIWAAALVVVVPTGVIIGREIYDYIVWVMTDVVKLTANRGGFSDQLLYYSFGPGGQHMLGSALLICLAAWGIGIGYALVRRRGALPRILAVFAVILISYAIPTVTVAKHWWFGTAFDAILLLATVYLIALLCEPFAGSPSHPGLRAAISALAGVAGAALLLSSNLAGQPLEMDRAYRIDVTNRTTQIWDVLRRHELIRKGSEPPGHLSNVMTIAVEPIVGPVISLYAIKEDLPIRDVDYSYARTVDELLAQLPNMDYVVVGRSYEFVLSGARLGDALRDAIDTKTEFSRIAALPIGRSGALVSIYERKLP
jgi:hypothetical protein